MKRRQFMTRAAVTGAAAASTPTVSAPALSQGRKELKLVTSFPKNFPGLGTSAARLSKRISQATQGRIRVRLYDGGELVAPFEVFDAVSKGDAEMYFSAEYYFPGKSKALNFFTAVPFGMTAPEFYAWIYYGGGQQLWDEVHADFGTKPFIGPSTGVQMGGWFNREINTLDDFKGLKFRMPGLGGEVLRALGVAVVNLPGSEIFPALQSGAIDGTEWVGPWHDLAFGFYKVVKNYHWPGFHEPGTSGSYAINRKFWDSLGKEDQLAIQLAIEAECQIQTAEYNARSPEALDVLVSKHGVKLHRFPDELLKQMGRISGEVVSQIGNSDPATKKVWDSYRKFRRIAIGWSKIGEQGFMNARSLPFTYG